MSNFDRYASLLSKLSNDVQAGTFFQVVVHLSHYIYAMERLREVAFTTGRSMSARHSFYIESLYTMLANWFSIEGKEGRDLLKRALTTLGLEAQLTPIDRTLDAQIGDTTLREIVREFRNAQATHKIFKGDIQVRLAQKHSIDPLVLGEWMQTFLDEMAEHILQLQAHVERAFAKAEPELYALVRSAGYFTSVLPA